ncbi:MAG: (d)CMP kinase [Hyphomicrobiaceae bacterium]
MIIAVDGPAASGKGTVSRRIASTYGLAYLDTGLLYRAVARDMLAIGHALTDETAAAKVAAHLDANSLDDDALRSPGAGNAASIVAQHQEVRQKLLRLQRAFSVQPCGAVLDGRDIGTVVCPDANVKLFVTAEARVRAERRYLELSERGEKVTQDEILAMILDRDARDRDRPNSPMRPAIDALLLDTSNLDINQSFEAAIELIKRKIGPPDANAC